MVWAIHREHNEYAVGNLVSESERVHVHKSDCAEVSVTDGTASSPAKRCPTELALQR